MTALSTGILIFLIVMLSTAASINYLRQWRQRRRAGVLARESPDNSALGGVDAGSTDGSDSGVTGAAERERRAARPAEARVSALKPVAVKPAGKNIDAKAGAGKTAMQAGAARPSKTRVVYARKYRAVGVRPQLNCCRAVLVFENIRFLAEEAPHFPVPGCDAESCRCQYIYYADRREEERRSTFGMAGRWAPAIGSDRRRADRRRAPPPPR